MVRGYNIRRQYDCFLVFSQLLFVKREFTDSNTMCKAVFDRKTSGGFAVPVSAHEHILQD